MIKWLLAIICSCFTVGSISAQPRLPRVIPPAPESSALFRFTDFPVNGATGIPEISIPIYNVTSGSLNVPVSISYYAGGRQANDQTGPIGLGWSLMAGGRISRTIKDLPDDESSFEESLRKASAINQNSASDLSYLQERARSRNDMEHDIFSFTCGNSSGKFVINANGHIVQMPKQPLLITGPEFPNNIKDASGVEYQFNAHEFYSSGTNIISSKLLTLMLSPDKKDTVEFKYQLFGVTDDSYSGTLTIDDNDDSRSSIPGEVQIRTSDTQYNRLYTVQRLTEILFKDGKVRFNLKAVTGEISTIEILNKQNMVIRTIVFNRSVMDAPIFTGTLLKQKLDNLIFRDSNNATADKYTFYYQPSNNFNGKGKDLWGYLNSKSNALLTPSYEDISIAYNYYNSNYDFNGGDRSIVSTTQSMIKKIIYPTGGSSEFVFEPNWYQKGNQSPKHAPGLRVRQIISRDNIGRQQKKTYKYGNNEDGIGFFRASHLGYPDDMIRYMSSQTRTVVPLSHTQGHYGSYRTRIYASEFSPEIAELLSEPVTYGSITVYDGDENANNGKTMYSFSRERSHEMSYFSPPTYGWPLNFNPQTDPDIVKPYISQYNYWTKEHQTGVSHYKKINGSWEGVKGQSYDYVDIPTDTLRGLFISKFLNTPSDNDDHILALPPFNFPVYQYDDYYIVTGTSLLESKTEWEGTPLSSTTTTYKYNSHQLPDTTIVKRSNEDEIISKTKYPFDISKTVHTAMVANNMLNYGVEQTVYKGSNILSSEKTDYKDWGSSIIAPEVISTKKGTDAYEPRIRFIAYDKGNGRPLAVKKENGPVINYIYGYNKSKPVAEILNADTNQIAFANFESGDKGNWTYQATGVNSSDSKTGNKSFSGQLSKISLPSGNYIVELWAKGSGSVTVNGSGKGINNEWKLYTWLINAATSVSVVSGSSKIDDVRLYPESAQMKTYSYEPLVGLTSVTDEKSNVSYYDYDSYQRLSHIRDKDGNILKQFQYNTINPAYFSAGTSIELRKNNCGPDYYGQAVTYELSPGSFTSNISQADADAKAQNDIAQNAQNYVNSVGQCSQFTNLEERRWIQRNNCGGMTGSEVEYVVAAGKYKSAISIQDAQNKAIAEIGQLGQPYANINGVCLTEPYKNIYMSGYFKKSCPAGYKPAVDSTFHSIAAGTYTSLRSLADANQKAQLALHQEGLVKAEAISCDLRQTTSFSFTNSTNYTFTVTFVTSGGTITESIPLGQSSFTVPDDVTIISLTESTCSSCDFSFRYASQRKTGYLVSFTVVPNERYVEIGNN